MRPIVLIVSGVIFVLLGIGGLLALFIRPFINSIQIVFFHNKESLQHNSEDENVILEKAKKPLKTFFTFSLVIGVILLGFGLWLKYAPRGNDSLLSKYINGFSTGNDTVEYQQGQDNNTTGSNTDVNGNKYEYRVIVSEKTILFNEQEIGGTEKFEEFLKQLDRIHTILLIDDFAVSTTYHKVEDLLNNYGMEYTIESDE